MLSENRITKKNSEHRTLHILISAKLKTYSEQMIEKIDTSVGRKIYSRRILQRLSFHILAKEFKKVRFYGFMANRCRERMLALCRILPGVPLSCQQETDDLLNDTAFLFWKYFGIDISTCPDCGTGHRVLKTSPAANTRQED